MTIYSWVDDRKVLVKELERRTGFKANYMGAPTFAFHVGPYEVNRNGRIEVKDEDADIELLRGLHMDMLVDSSWDPEAESFAITLPMEPHTDTSLVNWVHILHSKQDYFTKIARSVGAFRVDSSLLEALKGASGRESVIEILRLHSDAYDGFAFEDDQISITGFPQNGDTEMMKAYSDLIELANKTALTQQRIKAAKPAGKNEKYEFRIWLLRLGMIGDEYSTTRKLLLKHLSGNTAFRTKDQVKKAKEKLKQKKVAADHAEVNDDAVSE